MKTEQEIKEIVNSMTIEEKSAQINQKLYGWQIYDIVNGKPVLKDWFLKYLDKVGAVGSIYGILRADPFTRRDFKNGLNVENSRKILKEVSDLIKNKSRFNIRPLFIEEAPHGHQGLNSTLYPTNIAIGATFNPSLYGKGVSEISSYLQSLNVNIGLFSGIDIVRNQKWGRSEECYSEDPVLSEQFLKESVNNSKLDAYTNCLKHFAAQGDPYLGQNSGSVNIGIRELYEIHFKGCMNVVKDADIIMAAYNEIDGIPCHINKNLLKSKLREQFGFSGVVLSDGCALSRIESESITKTDVAAMALDAGVDLSLWDDTYEDISDAVKNEIININDLNNSVMNVLNLKNKLGLIDSELVDHNYVENNSSQLLANESIILAKNDNDVLPIQKNSKVLLVGSGFNDLYTLLGDYTSVQDISKYDNVVEAFQKQFKDVTYVNYDEVYGQNLDDFEHVIVCAGGSSKRNFDMKFEPNGAVRTTKSDEMECGENADVSNIAVKKIQEDTIRYLKSKNCSIITVFIQGRAYSMESVLNNSDAIILAFYPGHFGASAIRDVITGDVNPSGKCPVTILKSSDYVGYNYNNKKDFRKEFYIDNSNIVAFAFGHGLSYSKFKYSNLNFNVRDTNIVFEVDVSNVSNIVGKEVVQLYVEKENSYITKRSCELVAFSKVEIAANSSQKITFNINFDKLTTFNLNEEFELEKGVYKFFIGNAENRIMEVEWTNNHKIIMGVE